MLHIFIKILRFSTPNNIHKSVGLCMNVQRTSGWHWYTHQDRNSIFMEDFSSMSLFYVYWSVTVRIHVFQWRGLVAMGPVPSRGCCTQVQSVSGHWHDRDRIRQGSCQRRTKKTVVRSGRTRHPNVKWNRQIQIEWQATRLEITMPQAQHFQTKASVNFWHSKPLCQGVVRIMRRPPILISQFYSLAKQMRTSLRVTNNQPWTLL